MTDDRGSPSVAAEFGRDMEACFADHRHADRRARARGPTAGAARGLSGRLPAQPGRRARERRGAAAPPAQPAARARLTGPETAARLARDGGRPRRRPRVLRGRRRTRYNAAVTLAVTGPRLVPQGASAAGRKPLLRGGYGVPRVRHSGRPDGHADLLRQGVPGSRHGLSRSTARRSSPRCRRGRRRGPPAPDLEDDRWTQRFDIFDRARAVENQVVWVSSNQSGTFGSLRFVCSAKIVGPGGDVLAGTGTSAGMAIADVDVRAALDGARRAMAHLRDRGPARTHRVWAALRSPPRDAVTVSRGRGGRALRPRPGL